MSTENLILFLVIGIIAGYLAGKIMKGKGFGLLGDLIVGVIGSFIGVWIFGLLGIWTGGILGLLIASVFSAAILPLSTAYAVCEALGWETGVDRRPREAPGFFAIYTLIILLGAAPILLPQAPLVSIMFWSQTLNGLLLPFVLLVMLRLINDPEIMGHYVNSVLFNLVAWGTAAIMIALSALLVITGGM